jgi:mono/diheme cytochrome c family protein
MAERKHSMLRPYGISAFVLALVCAPLVFGQRPADQPPGDTIESGRETYLFHCASCHGRDGGGNGPVAPALKTRPPDLTTVARRRGGKFPEMEMIALVTGKGRVTPAHGSSDMPVWGPLFRELNPFDSRVDVRLNRLIGYLESIQVK